MNASFDTDVLIIGAGPAGSATAILLAAAGVRVVLVEQHAFPRQKVCGECLSAGALALLDELGVGEDLRALAAPEIRQVGWMGIERSVVAAFPRCASGAHPYGRAIGRDRLDTLLIGRARSLGVRVLQPAKVRHVTGTPGHFLCTVGLQVDAAAHRSSRAAANQLWLARVVIDAHGSWEQGPQVDEPHPRPAALRTPPREADLFAFKAIFVKSTLPPGLLPVIAFPGGYGGMVVADNGRTTLACCIRRDALRLSRAGMPGAPAGLAVAATLRSCRGVAEALASAEQEGAWLSVGPIRPGIRVDGDADIFRVGNAAGETHPLIGEGINMALQSARLVATRVSRLVDSRIDASSLHAANRAYAKQWRAAFGSRLRYATWYAQMAMRPAWAGALSGLLRTRPSLMTHAARWAGKASAATLTVIEDGI